MIVRARSVVTMDGAPIANGTVVVNGNKISRVGEWEQTSEEVIDLGECALLPGLINAHCHLDYTCLRNKISPRKSFADWIRAINAEKAKLTAEDYVRAIDEGFLEARRFGTTSIANLTGFPELISQVHEEIRTWWFAELIDIRNPSGELPDGIFLAPHAPYTASPDLFRRCDRDAQSLTTHLAESAEEMEMSLRGKGALAEFLRSISKDLFEANGVTPVEHLAKICRLDERWLLVHLNEIRGSDFELLGNAHVVHCPRSHAYFGHVPFEFQEFRNRGFNICLGTDSLASNYNLSLFAEMRAFQKTFPEMAAKNILEMVTTNSAAALRMESALGKIRAGYLADLIAIPFRGSRENIFDEIMEFDGDVRWMMIDGKSVDLA